MKQGRKAVRLERGVQARMTVEEYQTLEQIACRLGLADERGAGVAKLVRQQMARLIAEEGECR